MAADVDLDGKVDSSEFSGMIEVMKSNMTLVAELSFSFGVIEAGSPTHLVLTSRYMSVGEPD